MRGRIDARKAAVKARNDKRGKGASKSGASAAPEEGGEWLKPPPVVDHAVEQRIGFGLDDFVASDRIEVMQRMLADPRIQDMVLLQLQLPGFEDLLEQEGDEIELEGLSGGLVEAGEAGEVAA